MSLWVFNNNICVVISVICCCLKDMLSPEILPRWGLLNILLRQPHLLCLLNMGPPPPTIGTSMLQNNFSQ